MTFPNFSIPKVVFHDFPDLENFYFIFHDFPKFSRICMNPVSRFSVVKSSTFSDIISTDDVIFIQRRKIMEIQLQ